MRYTKPHETKLEFESFRVNSWIAFLLPSELTHQLADKHFDLHSRCRFGSLDRQVGFRNPFKSLCEGPGIGLVKHREIGALFECRHAHFAENSCRCGSLRQECLSQGHAPVSAGNQTDQ